MLSLTHCSVRGSDLYGHLIHEVERDAANPDAVGGGRLAIVRHPPAHVGRGELQVVVDAAHRDLHAVEAELLRDRQRFGLGAQAERPVAGADAGSVRPERRGSALDAALQMRPRRARHIG